MVFQNISVEFCYNRCIKPLKRSFKPSNMLYIYLVPSSQRTYRVITVKLFRLMKFRKYIDINSEKASDQSDQYLKFKAGR